MPDVFGSRLRSLLETQYAGLRRKLEYIVGSRDDASDALQETWLRLGSVSGSSPIGKPDAYVLQVAVNAATDQYRRDRRKLTCNDIDALFDVEDELADPARIASARSEVRVLEEALLGLSTRRREILLAAHVDGLLNREIAEQFNISQSLVEKELRHALRHCQQRLGASTEGRVRKLGGARRG